MPKMKLNKFAALVIGTMSVAVAGATTITTTNFNTWKSSAYLTGSPTELSFYPVSSSNYNTAAGIILTPGGATSPAFDFTGMDNGSYNLQGDGYQKILSTSTNSGVVMNVAFQTPENAILMYFPKLSASMQYTITLSDGQSLNTSSQLFAFSLSHTVTGLSISTTPGTQVAISDFWYGTSSLIQDAPGGTTPTSPTPEGGTLWLLAGGSLLLMGATRKFQFNAN